MKYKQYSRHLVVPVDIDLSYQDVTLLVLIACHNFLMSFKPNILYTMINLFVPVVIIILGRKTQKQNTSDQLF